MRKIFLARHAESLLHGCFCGSSDPVLSLEGVQQARELALKLRPFKVCHVYSSPLRRATMTAEEISEVCGCRSSVVEELREIDFGLWEGLCWEQIEQGWPAYSQRWIAEFPGLPAPQGESFEVFERRVESAFFRIREEIIGHSLHCACIVTHGGVMRSLLAALTGKRFAAASSVATAAFCELQMDDGGRIGLPLL